MSILYKIELFSVTLLSFIILVALDINSEPDDAFLDYRNLQVNDLEDIAGFILLASFISMFISIFFHVIRIIQLRKFVPDTFFYKRMLLLVSSILIIAILIALIYYTDDAGLSRSSENLLMAIIITVQALFFGFYLIHFLKENKAVCLFKLQYQKTIIDELHYK